VVQETNQEETLVTEATQTQAEIEVEVEDKLLL